MLHPYGTEQKWVLVIRDYTAYLDASGTHQGSPVVAMAGFVATARAWAKIAKGWTSVLKSFGLPYFHMKEFASAIGPRFGRFSGDEHQQNLLIRPLAKLIRENVQVAFGGSIVVADIDAVVPPPFRSQVDPLSIVFQVTIQVLLRRWADEHVPPNEQLAIIVDQDDCLRMLDMHSAYYGLKALWDTHDRLGPIQFADKKRVIPLQTPDMLAHQVFRHLKEGLPEKGLIRNVLTWMLDGVPHQPVTQFDQDGLRWLIQQMQGHQGPGGVTP
jgi:uncharacterized protein DUF3800